MKRYYIVEGDQTTVGGVVQKHTGSGSTTSWHGKVVSNIGDQVACPACKSVGVIQAVGSRLPFGNKGYTPAMNDDICVCKCSPPPKLIHSQTVFSQDTDDSSESLLAIFDSISSLNQQHYHKKFAQKFLIQDESTQHPLANICYEIFKDNILILSGKTNEDGYTQVVSSDNEDEIEIRIINEDEVHGNCCKPKS